MAALLELIPDEFALALEFPTNPWSVALLVLDLHLDGFDWSVLKEQEAAVWQNIDGGVTEAQTFEVGIGMAATSKNVTTMLWIGAPVDWTTA